MAPKSSSSDGRSPASADDPGELELETKLKPVDRGGGDISRPSPLSDGEDEQQNDLEIDEEEDDEDLVVFTAREAAGALATISGFVKPLLSRYKKLLTF